MKIETIADIVAEKRNRADEIERNVAEKMKRGEMISDQFARGVVADLRKEADRIEAAWRETCGNAAAMREAALPWIAFAEWLLENAGKDALGAAIRDNGPIIRQRLEELRDALAAPPRNCDVPHKDGHELWLRWQAYCAEIYPSRMSFSTWLLDLAQEGGAK